MSSSASCAARRAQRRGAPGAGAQGEPAHCRTNRARKGHYPERPEDLVRRCEDRLARPLHLPCPTSTPSAHCSLRALGTHSRTRRVRERQGIGRERASGPGVTYSRHLLRLVVRRAVARHPCRLRETDGAKQFDFSIVVKGFFWVKPSSHQRGWRVRVVPLPFFRAALRRPFQRTCSTVPPRALT